MLATHSLPMDGREKTSCWIMDIIGMHLLEDKLVTLVAHLVH